MLGSTQTGLGSVPTAAGDDSSGGGDGTITSVTSAAGTIDVTNPAGPVVNVEVNLATAPPPLVSAISSAGVSEQAARADHTHGSTVADWGTAGSIRYFACDGTNGNDANAGWSDASQAAAGAVAVKTLTRLAAIIPKVGQSREFRAAIHAGAYSDPILDLSGLVGYAKMLVIGTATVPSAGATAFLGDANDTICAGMTTATGMNVAGYNATAYSVDGEGTPSLTLQLAGGGAPAFAAPPARPYGCRLRFDAATTTVALRNFADSIIFVTGGNTLVLGEPLPANPVAGDVCYIEMPGVSGQGSTLCQESGSQNGPLQIAGVSCGALRMVGGAIMVAGCEASSVIGSGTNYMATRLISNVPSTSRVQGMGMRSDTTQLFGGFATLFDSVDTGVNGVFALEELSFIQWERCAAPGMVLYGGAHAIGNNVAENVGTNSSTTHGATCQIWGVITSGLVTGVQPAGLINYGGYGLARIRFRNMGANPCVRVNGAGLGVSIQNISGGVADGNADVGLDLSPAGLSGNTIGAMGCALALVGTPSATGSNGDVRLADGQIVSWTALLTTGISDSRGNRVISATGPTSLTKFSGPIIGAVGAQLTYFSDPGPYGASGEVNQTTPCRYPTSQRLAIRMRVTNVFNNSVNATTVTLYKNGVATAMQVSIPAGSATYTKFLDAAHPVLFADGDDYDLRGDDPAGDSGGAVNVTGALEWAV